MMQKYPNDMAVGPVFAVLILGSGFMGVVAAALKSESLMALAAVLGGVALSIPFYKIYRRSKKGKRQ